MKLFKLSILLLATMFGLLTNVFSQHGMDGTNPHEGDPNDPNRTVINEDNEKIQQGSLPHKNNTLSLLKRAFAEHQVDYLNKISLAKFQQSEWYKKLQGYLKDKKINLNHTSETATQEFLLSDNSRIFVDFDKKPDNEWYIADAYMMSFSMENGKRQERRTELDEKGFAPLQYDSNFDDLVDRIERGTIDDYYGLAPHGKLDRKFVKDNRLQLSRDKTLRIKNIIIHDGKNKIEDIVFLILRYCPPGYSEGPYENYENQVYKSGWLVAEGGPMSELYKPGEDVYMDYLLERDQRQILSEPNEVTVPPEKPVPPEKKAIPPVGPQPSLQPGVPKKEVPKQDTPVAGEITGIKCDNSSNTEFKIILEFGSKPVTIELQNEKTLVQDKKIVLKALKGSFMASYEKKQNCERLSIHRLAETGEVLEIGFSDLTDKNTQKTLGVANFKTEPTKESYSIRLLQPQVDTGSGG